MEISGSRLANHPSLTAYPARERSRENSGVTKEHGSAAAEKRHDSALTEHVVHGELLEKDAAVDYGQLLGRARALAQDGMGDSRFNSKSSQGASRPPYVQGALSAYESNAQPAPPVSRRRIDTYV